MNIETEKNNSRAKDNIRKPDNWYFQCGPCAEMVVVHTIPPRGSTCPSIENNTPYHFTASKLKVLCFRMESRFARTIRGAGQFVGKRCLYFSMKWMMGDISSPCRVFVYKDMTSAVTKSALGGSGGSFSMRLRKCFCVLNARWKIVK